MNEATLIKYQLGEKICRYHRCVQFRQPKHTRNSIRQSHRKCGHPRHLCYATLQTLTMISTTTGSWIRSRLRHFRLRRDRIKLPVVVEIISNVCKCCITKVTTVSTLTMGPTYIALEANLKPVQQKLTDPKSSGCTTSSRTSDWTCPVAARNSTQSYDVC